MRGTHVGILAAAQLLQAIGACDLIGCEDFNVDTGAARDAGDQAAPILRRCLMKPVRQNGHTAATGLSSAASGLL